MNPIDLIRRVGFPRSGRRVSEPSADLKVEIRLNLDLRDWHEFEVKVVRLVVRHRLETDPVEVKRGSCRSVVTLA